MSKITHLICVYLVTDIVSISHFKNLGDQLSQRLKTMIIFPESFFPPIPVTSDMKVELSAQDLEQQSPHVTSDEPLIPPLLLPLAFDCSASVPSCTGEIYNVKSCLFPARTAPLCGEPEASKLPNRRSCILFCLCMPSAKKVWAFNVFLQWCFKPGFSNHVSQCAKMLMLFASESASTEVKNHVFIDLDITKIYFEHDQIGDVVTFVCACRARKKTLWF